jgi:serine/threonine protein kinase
MAIEYLHTKNILYRDLKPENVLVKEDGHLMLADFGLSKQIDGEVYESKSPVGSYAYLAPEVLNEVQYGKSIDWYQVGVTLYELVSGITPFYSNDIE